MPAYLSVCIHDREPGRSPFLVEPKSPNGSEPYWCVSFNRSSVVIFTDAGRLLELRDAIDKAIEAQGTDVEAIERAEELALELRDEMETGADRCPPRE